MRVYWWPKGFFVDSYTRILSDNQLWTSYRNTIIYCSSRAVLTLLTSVMAAYPLTVPHLFGRKFVTMFLLIPMYVTGGIIPEFILMTKLGLYNYALVPDPARLLFHLVHHSGALVFPHRARGAARVGQDRRREQLSDPEGRVLAHLKAHFGGGGAIHHHRRVEQLVPCLGVHHRPRMAASAALPAPRAGGTDRAARQFGVMADAEARANARRSSRFPTTS